MLTTTLEIITPETAKEWLTRNLPENRKVSPAVVAQYARDMENGQFRVCNTAIAFDEKGNLLDGQHRLLGCVKANKPFESFVTRGLATSSYKVIDIGRPRNAHAALKYEHNDDVIYYSTDTIAIARLACRSIPDAEGNVHPRPSVPEIEGILTSNHALFTKAHSWSMWCVKKIPAAAVLGSLAAYINGVSAADIRSFNDAAFANTIDPKKDPGTTRLALEMRNVFDSFYLRHSNFSSIYILAIYESYLKAYLDGKTRKPKVTVHYPIHFNGQSIAAGDAMVNGRPYIRTLDAVFA